MALLIFFRTVRCSFRACDNPEGVDVHVVVHPLPEDAKYTYDAEVNPSKAISPLQETWKYVVHELLALSLTEDVPYVANRATSRGEQGTTKK